MRQLLHVFGRHALDAHLHLQVGDDRNQVAVAAALAKAVDGALHLRSAILHRNERVRHTHFAVVVRVDADR
jgi:hypothetical protein